MCQYLTGRFLIRDFSFLSCRNDFCWKILSFLYEFAVGGRVRTCIYFSIGGWKKFLIYWWNILLYWIWVSLSELINHHGTFSYLSFVFSVVWYLRLILWGDFLQCVSSLTVLFLWVLWLGHIYILWALWSQRKQYAKCTNIWT